MTVFRSRDSPADRLTSDSAADLQLRRYMGTAAQDGDGRTPEGMGARASAQRSAKAAASTGAAPLLVVVEVDEHRHVLAERVDPPACTQERSAPPAVLGQGIGERPRAVAGSRSRRYATTASPAGPGVRPDSAAPSPSSTRRTRSVHHDACWARPPPAPRRGSAPACRQRVGVRRQVRRELEQHRPEPVAQAAGPVQEPTPPVRPDRAAVGRGSGSGSSSRPRRSPAASGHATRRRLSRSGSR